MSEEGIDVAKAQRALDAFLVDNQELEQLSARLSAFNLFNVLRIDHAEIRHSNVLAWLLAPGESHGLGPTFLRRFLSRLLMDNDGAAVSLSPAQIELMNFNDIEVLREWQNIDILARSRANGWCLLIENKIHSGEGKGQLLRYLGRVKKEMPDSQIIPVYLTLDGDEPSDEAAEAGYLAMSHAELLELVEQIVTQHSSRIPDDASVLLNHYLATVRRLTMQDQELVDLCKAIYRKHREAIDLIVEYGSTSNVREAILNEIEAQVDCEFCIPRGSQEVWFLPKAMGELLPHEELDGWPFLPWPSAVMCWYHYQKKKDRLQLSLEVGPVADPQRRKELLRTFESHGFSVPKSAFGEGRKFTRIISHFQKLKKNEEGDPDTSDDSVRRTATGLWDRLWNDGDKILDVLRASYKK